jgi:hypothetical protein
MLVQWLRSPEHPGNILIIHSRKHFLCPLVREFYPYRLTCPTPHSIKLPSREGLAKICCWVIRYNSERSHSPGCEGDRNITGFVQNTCYKIMPHPFCAFIMIVPIMVSF